MMSLVERGRWLWRYWRPHRKFLILLILLTVLSTAVAMAYPLVFRHVIDLLTRSAGFHPDFDVSGVLVLLALVAGARLIAQLYPAFRAWMNFNLQVGIREQVFAAILQKDHRFFNTFRTGDLVTRLTDDVEDYPKLAWFGCSGIFRAVESGSILLFCVTVMFWLDWRLALLSMLPLPVMGLYLYRVLGSVRRAFEDQQREISRTNDMLEATFAGIRIVKAFASEEGQAGSLGKILDERVKVQLRVASLLALLHSLYSFISRVGQVLVLAIGGVMVLGGQVSLGTIFAFYVYLDMLMRPMFDLPNLVVTARQAAVCMDREQEILCDPGTMATGGDRPLADLEEIRLAQVAVGYDSDHPVVIDISLTVKKGEHLALVGPVASGKTTLLKTIAGLLPPQAGRILVNGQPLDVWRQEDYWAMIGYVPQESLLFSESIRENVVLGRPQAEDGLEMALRVAQLETELVAMPQGVQTVLGQKGGLISGGQKQRIAIARALAHRPDLFLLDDCTASLDAATEDRFWSAFQEVRGDAALITVSHRVATIKRADRILVLHRGRIASEGTHESLASTCPVYAEFLETARYRG
ncbi:MAG: ABC transporter ATP-binding protein [Bradymonadales bacterium]|nr:ABC transporter ATP-binding protein [Bradymonadales bacterium]